VKLYFIHAETDEGANYDLHVIARDRGQAIELWAEHYALTDDEVDMEIRTQVLLAFDGPNVLHKVRNRDEFRTGEQPHALDWDLKY